MKTFYIYLFVFALASIVYGQPQAPDTMWARAYGGAQDDIGYDVKPTSDGGFIVVGSTESFGPTLEAKIYLLKIDGFGNLQWSRTYGRSVCVGKSILQTSDGGYLIAGSAHSESKGICLRTDSLGNELWFRAYTVYGTHEIEVVQPTIDGNYILIGNAYSWLQSKITIIKIDTLGNVIWAKGCFNNTGVGNYIQPLTDGSYLIAGCYEGHGTTLNGQILLSKLDILGNVMWCKSFGGRMIEQAFCVREITNNGIIMTGSVQDGDDFRSLFLLKTSSSGAFQWYHNYDALGLGSWGNSVILTNDGGFLAVGNTSIDEFNVRTFVLKTDSVGTEQWNGLYSLPQDQDANAVQITQDGGYIIVGWTSFANINEDVYLIRLEPEVAPEYWIEAEPIAVESNSSNQSIKNPSLTNLSMLPNPFNSALVIRFEMLDANPIDLKIYDIAGREIWRLESRNLHLGTNEVVWDAEGMPSGIYFVRLSVVGIQSSVRKVVLVK
jgi:hypothetical protein